MALQPLEHAAGLDAENEFSLGLECQVLHQRGDGVGARAEAGAVDLLRLAAVEVGVVDDQLARHGAAMLVRDIAQLFAADTVDREHRLDVVHDGIRLVLFREVRLSPVLRLVVSVPLRGEIIGADQLLGERHHLQ